MHITAVLALAALPWLSRRGEEVIQAVVEKGGRIRGTADFARSLRFQSRHQLARFLEREGLPPLEELTAWIRVLIWVREWEGGGTALSRGALDAETDPAIRFRVVERTTGKSWSCVQRLGLPWVLLQFRERCGQPATWLGKGSGHRRVGWGIPEALHAVNGAPAVGNGRYGRDGKSPA